MFLKFADVVGYDDRKNDVIYVKPLNAIKQSKVLVFFPGDVQDYIENMEAHRDNKHYKEWNLVDTGLKLQKKFPVEHILVIKPSRMDYKTFSCFKNFVKSTDLGVPEHNFNFNSLKHLDNLIKNLSNQLPAEDTSCLESLNLILIGFSKGCVVLNQFLYELHNFITLEPDLEITGIIKKIKDMFWLDGGHCGGKNTWITDKEILNSLCKLEINIYVHVSPYQIRDDRRPWIKKEEKQFSEFLRKNCRNFERTVHFEEIPPSIGTHFDVINVFKK